MQAEIVTIGTELLLGEIVDTNSAWIAQRLTTIGLDLYYTTTVGDNLARMTAVLRQCLERSDIVITTGGLGPTVDDVTREAVAAATDRELVLDQDLVEEIAAFFARRKYTMTDNNRKQACLPAGARVIHNPVGTAPCFAVEHNGHMIISLPGVPHEMRYLMENKVLPDLMTRYGLHGVIKSRVIRTCGIGESTIDSQIGDLMHLSNPTVGTAAHPGQTDVRITAKADSEQEVNALIAPVEAEIRARIGEYVFGVDRQTLSGVACELLAEAGLRMALIETTTRGELGRCLSDMPQASDVLAGTTVVLDGAALIKALGVGADTIAAHGYPSQEVANAAAQAVRRRYEADLGLALLGPADASDDPPVYYALALSDRVLHCSPRQGRGGPSGRGWLMNTALDLLRRHLSGLPIH